jgi:hypothetical protein
MSADNFVGVRPNKDGSYSIFEYGSMSVYGEDCMYLSDETGIIVHPLAGGNDGPVNNRMVALTWAHDIVNRMDICEYGVVEMSPVPDEPCGRCYVCVNCRHIVADDIERCDKCHDPIVEGDWLTTQYDPTEKKVLTVHTRCESR